MSDTTFALTLMPFLFVLSIALPNVLSISPAVSDVRIPSVSMSFVTAFSA